MAPGSAAARRQADLYTNAPKFTATIDYGDYPPFAASAGRILSSPDGRPTLKEEWGMFWRILRVARRSSILVLRSSWGRFNVDVLAGAVIGLWPRRYRPVVVLTGCMWQPETGPRHLVERLVVKLLDRAVCLYAVQSSEELTLFPETWGVSPDKTRLCLYFSTFTERDLAGAPPADGRYVFAGGNSHREYGPLLEAARQLPELSFILATNRLKGVALPPNVTAAPVPHAEFVSLMRGAAAVVVPLRQGMRRAVGQQTYLNAMWLGKPTIVSQALAVRDHVAHKRTALIVDGSAEGYVRALRWLFAPDNQAAVQEMCQRASAIVSAQFTFENHAARLLEIIGEAARLCAPE